MTKLTHYSNQNDPNMYAIIALNTGGSTTVEQNILTCAGLRPLKTLIGMYAGKSEPSYLVDYEDALLVHEVAKLYDQEAILVLSTMQQGKRTAYITETGTMKLMVSGEWKNLGSMYPKDATGYTFDPETGEYYTIV